MEIALFLLALLVLLVAGRVAVSTGPPLGSFIYHSARGSPGKSKGSVIAEKVFSLTGLAIVAALAAICLWAALVLVVYPNIDALVTIGFVALVAMSAAALRSASVADHTLVAASISARRARQLFATMLSGWTLASTPGGTTPRAFTDNSLDTRGHMFMTRFGGGTAHAAKLVGAVVFMSIGALITSTSTAFAGDAGLASSGGSSIWIVFAIVGAVALSLAGLATVKVVRR